VIYSVLMAAPLERPKTPLSVIVVGSVIAVVLGLFLFNMVIGFVATVTKLALAVAIIAAVAITLSRGSSKD
jgi:hypothetical protein